MLSKVVRKFRHAGIAGVYDAVRFRVASKTFRPYRHKISVGGVDLQLNIEDFEADTWYGRYRYGWIVWPEQEFDWIVRHVSPDDVIYDIGAHQGIMSMLFARGAVRGEVHAFETSAFNTDVARKNLALNGITNVVFNNMCVGAESGEATVSDDSGGVASLLPTSALNRQMITVPMVSGDDYSRTQGIHPTFVKIDVEGFEVEVLTGMKEVLSRRPKIHLELHNFKFEDRERYVRSCLELIDLSGYSIVMQAAPGTEMIPLGGIDDDTIDLISAGYNPHLYCLPDPSAPASAG